jgi:hypothetical protein
MIEKKYKYTDKICKKCNKEITYKNWSQHLKTKWHLKNEPDQTIKPGRPVTRKELLSQAKEYNLRGFTKWNKAQLLSVLNKAKKILFKKIIYKSFR